MGEANRPYEPPQVMPLNNLSGAVGDCRSGSGVMGDCSTGTSAIGSCYLDGAHPELYCYEGSEPQTP